MSEPRFTEGLHSYQSIFGGYRPVSHGQLDLSGFGLPGQLGGMFLLPRLNAMGAEAGMMPGQFQPIQNLYDQHMALRQAQIQNTAMEALREQDKMRMQHMLRQGAGMLSTGPLTASQGKMLNDMAGMGSKWLPMVATMAPGTVDAMFGTRGSGTVFGMGAADASRFMVGAGGITGLEPAGAAAMSEQVYKQLYGHGANLQSMRGIGAGSAGQMMAEMSRRGLMGMDGAAPGNLDAAGIGSFHSGRTAARIKEMAGVVSAMRDIFGDMGRGDAPMQELIAGLERLTQGGLSSMDSNRMESLVRRTQHMAKMAGVGIDAVATMQSASAARLEAAGIDRSMAADVVNSSMSFATAYGQVGDGGVGAWRKAGKEKLMAMDQRLREQAAGSAAAHQMGAIMMLGEQGALKGPALALYQAARGGDFSGMRYMAPEDFTRMLQASGVSEGMANQTLLNTRVTQEYVQRYRLQDVVRDQQMETDLAAPLRNLLGNGVRSTLGSMGLAGKESAVGSILFDALGKMSGATRANGANRTEALVLALEAGLDGGTLKALGGTADARRSSLRQLAISGWNSMENDIGTLPGLAGYESAHNIFALMSPETQRQRRIVNAQVESRAAMSQAMAGMGIAGPMQRIIDEITSGRDVDVKTLATRFLGSADRGDAITALQKVFAGSSEKYKRLKVLGADAERVAGDTGLTDAQRAARMSAISEERNKLAAELHTMHEGPQFGEAEKLAQSLGVSVMELLKGETFSGRKLDAGKVDMARAMAGSRATLAAVGLTPETAKIVRKTTMDSLLEKAAPNRKQAMADADKLRTSLIAAGRKAGLFKDRLDDALTDEDLDKVAGPGSDDTSLASLRSTLRDKGIGLGEYRKAVEDDEKAAKARELSLKGELRLINPGRAEVSATGVPSPGGS